MTLTNYAWPDVPRTAFQAGGAPPHAAAIGWALSRESNNAYATGYRRAAEGLFAQIGIERMLSPDVVVFPLAMLWRHSFELSLKDIIALGQQLDEVTPTSSHGHNLARLWSIARAYIDPLGDPNSPLVANAGSIIAEIDRLDPTGQGFRYPVLVDGQRSLSGIPDVLDLVAFQEAMTAIANFLDGVASELKRRIEWNLEQLRSQY